MSGRESRGRARPDRVAEAPWARRREISPTQLADESLLARSRPARARVGMLSTSATRGTERPNLPGPPAAVLGPSIV